VVVLAMKLALSLSNEDELWIDFGTGKNLRFLAIHEITSSLGPIKAHALPMFHALTGCDTVSSFVVHGKRSAWATWNPIPELTNALLTLTDAPTEIPEEAMQVIQRYVVLLCDRTSTHSEVNKARKMFGRKTSVQRISPTYAALEQHVRRAAFQGGHVWGQMLATQPQLPSPTSWGWTSDEEDGSYEPATLDHTL